jgi:hypothetical protein
VSAAPQAREGRRAPAAFTVYVETISYVSSMVEPGAGPAAGSGADFPVAAHPGDTVRTVLQRFAAGHPRLKAMLWDADAGGLGPHIEVVVNDALLGIRHELDSPVRDGDRIILTGQYIGG